MTKRGFALFLSSVLLLLMLPFAAHADVVVEPENNFYSRHAGQCMQMNRVFTPNGEKGFVSFKNSPGSKAQAFVKGNGASVYIMYTYEHRGETWGLAQIMDTSRESYGKRTTGWAPLSELLLNYDFISFAEEHEGEFYSYAGDYAVPDEVENLVMWSWPGSGEVKGTLKTDSIGSYSVEHAYKDEQGGEWGFIGYLMGDRNFWICLSDPENAEIAAFNPPPEPTAWKTDENAPQKAPSPTWLIGVLIALVVAGAILLIKAFWKPTKSGER